MKQVIVLCASIMLGIIIVGFLIGGNGSVFASMQSLWENEVSVRNMEKW